MFWRFGFCDEMRPVSATTWLNVVWTRPDLGDTSGGSASRYVPLSLLISRCSRIGLMIGCSSCSSVSASVDQPVFVRRTPLVSRPSLSNSSSPSCLGEPVLNSPPASSKMRPSSSPSFFVISPPSARKYSTSMWMPMRSTWARRQLLGDRQQRVRDRARPRRRALDLDAFEARLAAADDRGARGQQHTREALRDRLAGLGFLRGIEQERREHRVVHDALHVDAE